MDKIRHVPGTILNLQGDVVVSTKLTDQQLKRLILCIESHVFLQEENFIDAFPAIFKQSHHIFTECLLAIQEGVPWVIMWKNYSHLAS